MGNNQSTAEPRYRPTVSSSKATRNYVPSSPRPILKSKELTAKATSPNVSRKSPDAPNKTLFENVFPTHTPAGIVGRQEGWKYAVPFSSLLSEWTKDEWPCMGSFESEKIQLAVDQMNFVKGNPK